MPRKHFYDDDGNHIGSMRYEEVKEVYPNSPEEIEKRRQAAREDDAKERAINFMVVSILLIILGLIGWGLWAIIKFIIKLFTN